jgi:hypothetical protein
MSNINWEHEYKNVKALAQTAIADNGRLLESLRNGEQEKEQLRTQLDEVIKERDKLSMAMRNKMNCSHADKCVLQDGCYGDCDPLVVPKFGADNTTPEADDD